MKRRFRTRTWAVLAVSLLVVTQLAACRSAFKQGQVGVSLILKTLSNPYFVAMRNAAQAEARKDNVKLSIAAGTEDGDTQSQINAIDTAIARGDKGILITSNGNAVNAALRQAEDFGLYVIALDTPTIPASTVDITYATDNEQAGKLIGKYAASKLNGKKAVIAMLDLYNDQVASVDIERDHGFLEGMGINPGSTTQNAQEQKTGKYKGPHGSGDYQIACHRPTEGAIDGGRTGMEQCLSANPNINLVYSINEPAGEGAYAALKAAGKTKQAMIVSIDGSCQGLHYVQTGELDADAVQYPGKMAALGVSSIAKLARGGKKPAKTSGKAFLDTGTALVATDRPDNLKVQSVQDALKRCWGPGSTG
jgi:fructose transport system substrate-binding protein